MEKKEGKEIIFTDLDGTLLDKDYSFKKAEEGLKLLKEKNIPLIICTSKTRAEIEKYRKKIKNKHPFISENGGAIFIPKDYFKFSFKYTKKTKDYYIIELGERYKKLREELKKIESKTRTKIISFGEMSLKNISYETNLPKEEVKLARKREYDEAFRIIGKGKDKILREIKKRNLNYLKGGNYFHIIGENDKGKAMNILKNIYEKENKKKIKTLAIGDSYNDKEMLKNADESFLVQKNDEKWEKIDLKKIKKIKGVGPKGWNNIITEKYQEVNAKKAEKIYKKSLKVLKKLQMKNGAILASPPKSRYPYVYPRDHSICILGLIDASLNKESKKALEFILKTQKEDGSFPQRVDKKGEDASYKPIQLDNTGLVVIACTKYYQSTKDKEFLKKHKKKIEKSIEYIEKNLDKKNLFFTPNSIHEFPPYEKGLEIWANAVSYAAIKNSKKIGIKTNVDLNKIKKAIEKHLWNGKYFIKNIRLKESSSIVKDIDASSYSLADFSVFTDNNKKIKSNVKEIEKKLWHKEIGGICRYKKSIGRNNGGWGPWPHFTLMIARHYINIKDKKNTTKYLQWVIKNSYKNMLPEHIAEKRDFLEWEKDYKKAGLLRDDRKTIIKNIKSSKPYKKYNLAYSVLPLAWPHAEFIRTWNLYKKLEKFQK